MAVATDISSTITITLLLLLLLLLLLSSSSSSPSSQPTPLPDRRMPCLQQHQRRESLCGYLYGLQRKEHWSCLRGRCAVVALALAFAAAHRYTKACWELLQTSEMRTEKRLTTHLFDAPLPHVPFALPVIVTAATNNNRPNGISQRGAIAHLSPNCYIITVAQRSFRAGKSIKSIAGTRTSLLTARKAGIMSGICAHTDRN